MKRAFGGGRTKWARATAKRWAFGLISVAAIAMAGLLLFGPSAHAEPAKVAKWLNREYLADDRGVNYLDVNTWDWNFTYVEQTTERCEDWIRFEPSILANDPGHSSELFFYREASWGNYVPKLFVREPGKNAAGQDTCTESTRPIVVNDPQFRRITFYKNDEDKIVNIFTGVTFSHRGNFKGSERYFRDSEVADANNSCPDMILLHAAEPLDGQVFLGDTAEFLFGTGETRDSAILFSVEKNSSLGRVSETYQINGELNNIDPNTCRLRGSAIDKKLTGEYPLYSNGDNRADVLFISAGLDRNGTPAEGDANWEDDAFIIFVGSLDNLPRDSNGGPIEEPSDPNGGNPDQIDQQVCKGGALGWVICPIVSAIQGITDLLVDAMAYFLAVNPLPIGSGPIYEAWNNIRNIANIVFVIGFFVIIFSQATSIGISNYGIKRLLPRLILVAVATNVSYFVCSFLIDIFNIMGVGAANLIAIVNGGSAGTVTVSNGAGLLFAGGLAAAITAAFVTGAIVQLFPIIVGGALALFVVFLALVARQALIILLVIIAPLAFVAGLLPGTERWFSRWLNLFVGMLVLYPMTVGLFAAIRVATSILSAMGG